jgi:sarcosine oxidase subunit alpha
MDIATILADDVAKHDSVEIMLETTAVGIYADKKIGVLQGDRYLLIEPKTLIVAAGAREKGLAFPGCDLPGVYGAGAFQTLVNRDGIKPTERLFIVGGGNVGLIAAYHACRPASRSSASSRRLPRSAATRSTRTRSSASASPSGRATPSSGPRARSPSSASSSPPSMTTSRSFPAPQRTYEVDTLLIAVGLSPVNELLVKARIRHERRRRRRQPGDRRGLRRHLQREDRRDGRSPSISVATPRSPKPGATPPRSFAPGPAPRRRCHRRAGGR